MDQLQWVWGWQPALYLFLGGMGAGAFVMAAVLRFKYPGRFEKTVCVSMWAAVVCLSAGLLCLLTELTAPLRGLMMWQSFSNFSSWMTYGAWLVFSAVVVFGICALLTTPAVARLVDRGKPAEGGGRARVLNVLTAIGIALGLGVAAYTGVLLMVAPGVPLWNTWLLPCLFTVSAIDTGVALVELVAQGFRKSEPMGHGPHRFISTIVVALIVAELFVMLAFFLMLASGAGTTAASLVGASSAQTLLSGVLAPEFWVLVVALGLLFPLAVAAVGLRTGAAPLKKTADAADKEGVVSEAAECASWTAWAGPIGVLLGGCALRFLVLAAGAHANVVGDTMAQVFADMVTRL